MYRVVRKWVFMAYADSEGPDEPALIMRTAKAQISLRVSAGWSAPSLSTYKMIGYC